MHNMQVKIMNVMMRHFDWRTKNVVKYEITYIARNWFGIGHVVALVKEVST